MLFFLNINKLWKNNKNKISYEIVKDNFIKMWYNNNTLININKKYEKTKNISFIIWFFYFSEYNNRDIIKIRNLIERKEGIIDYFIVNVKYILN